MGLKKNSAKLNDTNIGLVIRKTNAADRVVALGGNPNVGKSTVFYVSLIWNYVHWNAYNRFGRAKFDYHRNHKSQ